MPIRALVLTTFALALAGCGGGDDGSAGEQTEPGATAQTETAGGGGEATGEGDPDAGELIFVANGCSFCHTLSDVAATGTVGPNLDQTKPSYELVVERVTNGKGVMPSFSDDITPQSIQDVAAYVSAVAGK